MSKCYERAPDEVAERAARVIELYHKDLQNAGVTVDFIYATADTGAAVMLGGYPCVAVVKIVNLKDRSKGMADAEITIDKMLYEGMTDEQKDGLLDHELYHLIVRRDAEGFIETDDLSRPCLKMRKHDWQLGWFTEVARRHGTNSPEVYQAQILWDNAGQAFFPMLMESGEAPKPKSRKLLVVQGGDHAA